MKPPLFYYGGKQPIAKLILGLIPEHKAYCEPFCGGAAVFFAKEPSCIEIINDANGELINFYEVLVRDFAALEKEVDISLNSRKLHDHARVVYQNPELFDRIKRAWAIWILANTSYGGKLNGSFSYRRFAGRTTSALSNKRTNFTEGFATRLQNAQIECDDALKVIERYDTADTFFYCDPPYVGANQGHYAGYGQEDFDGLLRSLETAKGKFLLSSYCNKTLAEFSRRNGWQTVEIKTSCSTSRRLGKMAAVTEVLTANYPIGSHGKEEATQ